MGSESGGEWPERERGAGLVLCWRALAEYGDQSWGRFFSRLDGQAPDQYDTSSDLRAHGPLFNIFWSGILGVFQGGHGDPGSVAGVPADSSSAGIV